MSSSKTNGRHSLAKKQVAKLSGGGGGAIKMPANAEHGGAIMVNGIVKQETETGQQPFHNGNKQHTPQQNGNVVEIEEDEDAMGGGDNIGLEGLKISEAMDVDMEVMDNCTERDVKLEANSNSTVKNARFHRASNMDTFATVKTEADVKQEPMLNGAANAGVHIPPKCGNGMIGCLLDGFASFPCKRCHRVFYCSELHRQQQYEKHLPDCKAVARLEVMPEQDYCMWVKHAAPHLYDVCLNFILVWPSLTTQWLPEIVERENNIIRHHLLLGTLTNQEQNHLLICGIDIPDRVKTDPVSEQAAKFDGTMYVIKRINHEAEVNRVRYMPQDWNIVATKSSSPEVFVFDCSKYPEIPEDNKFAPMLRLRGHQKEGFGLAWNPKDKGKLVSGSDDALVCLWDLNKTATTENNVKYLNASRIFRAHDDIVEDVDWHSEQKNVFASVGDDNRLVFWDTRASISEEAVFNRKGVHDGDVNSVSFSPFSEYALATGSSDSTVAIWDMRNMDRKLHTLEYHKKGVMQVQWSPHSASVLASTAKDHKVFFWDLSKISKSDSSINMTDDDPAPNELVFIHGGHVNIVNDISWNHHEMGMMASVTEDNVLQVWKVSEDLQAVYMGDDASEDDSGGSASEAFDD